MKIKQGFVMRSVAGDHIVVSVGEAIKSFNGVMKLNDVGAFLWGLIKEGIDKASMTDALVREYEVTAEVAVADAERFLEKLRGVGCLDE